MSNGLCATTRAWTSSSLDFQTPRATSRSWSHSINICNSSPEIQCFQARSVRKGFKDFTYVGKVQSTFLSILTYHPTYSNNKILVLFWIEPQGKDELYRCQKNFKCLKAHFRKFSGHLDSFFRISLRKFFYVRIIYIYVYEMWFLSNKILEKSGFLMKHL